MQALLRRNARAVANHYRHIMPTVQQFLLQMFAHEARRTNQRNFHALSHDVNMKRHTSVQFYTLKYSTNYNLF